MNCTKFVPYFLLIFVSLFYFGQYKNPKYNAVLAKKYAANEYGMKKYVFVLFKTGDNPSEDKDFNKKCFKSHLDNIKKLVKEKKLIVAGPFSKNSQAMRGFFIMDVASLEEAKKLLENDEAVKEKLLQPEFFEWNGSSALPAYLEVHDKIWQKEP